MGEHFFNQFPSPYCQNSFRKTIVQTVQMLPDFKLSLEMLSSNHVKIPYSVLIVFTIMMLAAPITPMPHVVEKILMLTNGTFTRPIDIFDLCFHLIHCSVVHFSGVLSTIHTLVVPRISTLQIVNFFMGPFLSMARVCLGTEGLLLSIW